MDLPSTGVTPLMAASEHGNSRAKDVVVILVELKASLSASIVGPQCTPLLLAIFQEIPQHRILRPLPLLRQLDGGEGLGDGEKCEDKL